MVGFAHLASLALANAASFAWDTLLFFLRAGFSTRVGACRVTSPRSLALLAFWASAILFLAAADIFFRPGGLTSLGCPGPGGLPRHAHAFSRTVVFGDHYECRDGGERIDNEEDRTGGHQGKFENRLRDCQEITRTT